METGNPTPQKYGKMAAGGGGPPRPRRPPRVLGTFSLFFHFCGLVYLGGMLLGGLWGFCGVWCLVGCGRGFKRLSAASSFAYNKGLGG
jgi:hypothetical protein